MKQKLTLYLLLASVIFFFLTRAHGQTISPVVAECGRRCSNQFTLTNNGVVPLAVSIEAKSFSIVGGQQVLRDLDPTVHLTLSETSARVGPLAVHSFDYKLRCDQLPCAVALQVAMTLGHTESGVQVRGILPEIIYSCEREKNCRKNILLAGGITP
jgi:hypothetical protein